MDQLPQSRFRPVIQEDRADQVDPDPELQSEDLPDIRPAPTSEEMEAALLAACERGDAETVRRILDQGIHVDARDSRGNTALMVACRNCQIEVVKILLGRGADVRARNSYGRKAMDVASDWGYPSIIELLRSCGSEESEPSLY